MQRRVEQADGDRIAFHGAEDGLEVGALHRQNLGERSSAPFVALGHDHFPHGREPVALEEHVLCAAEPGSLGPEIPTAVGVGRRIRVDPDLQVPEVVRPPQQAGEVAVQLRLHQGRLADENLAGRAIDGDPLTSLDFPAIGGKAVALFVHGDVGGSGDTRLAHPARHDGGVRGHPPAGRENGLGCNHAMKIFRIGLSANEDDLGAFPG